MNQLLLRRRQLMQQTAQEEEIDQYLEKPFTFTAKIPFTLEITTLDDPDFQNKFIKYKIDDGNWQNVDFTADWVGDGDYGLDTYIDVSEGEELSIISNISNWKDVVLGVFQYGSYGTSNDLIFADYEGNVCSLFAGDSFAECTSISSNSLYTKFVEAGFVGNNNCKMYVGDISNLRIPVSTIGAHGLRTFFYNQKYLTGNLEKLFPNLTTVQSYGCHQLFYGCTRLTNAPKLPATSLATYSYNQMFRNCTSLTEGPDLPATTVPERCYNMMFRGCTNLNKLKAMMLTAPGTLNNTYLWLDGVSATGTFIKNANANWSVSGTSGIPTGWTVQTA